MKKHRVAHLGLGGRGKIYVKPYLDSDRFTGLKVSVLSQVAPKTENSN